MGYVRVGGPVSSDISALVGRGMELKAVAELLDALEVTDEALALQVAGEPGIGKSRLLHELSAQSRARGHLVLSGRAAEFEAEHPFGVLGDALDDWLASLGRDRLAALSDGLAAELAIVFPAFAPLISAGAPELQQEERYRAYRAVRALLSSLAHDGPVVLVLDDVQWADPGSAELIAHLLAHPCRGPVLVALAFRPAQVSPGLDVALGAALRDQGVRRLDLAPLSRAAARELLGPDVSAPVLDRVYRESGGNPFYLLQLACADGLPGPAAGAPAVPAMVRATLAGELSSLSAGALDLLHGSAVAGDPFERSLAAGAADVAAHDALDLIDELLGSQLVYPTAVAGRFAFRHPIVRATVYELASSAWRARAHARIATLLAEANAPAAARAPHVERSAEHGDGDAIAVLVAAATSSTRRAPALAARWYAAALRLLPEAPDIEGRRIELLLAMANALFGAGLIEQGHTALSEVLERMPSEHPGRLAIVAACAGVELLLGRHRDARSRLTLAYRSEQDTRSPAAVLLQIELAAGACYEERFEEMLTWAERARDGAALLGQRAIEAVATGQLAIAQSFTGLPALDTMERAAAVMDALDDAELAGCLDLGRWVGPAEIALERHEQNVEHCQRVIDVARATGQGAALLVTMTHQAWSLMSLGRLDEAEERVSAAIEMGYLAPHLYHGLAMAHSSLIATYRGDYKAAVRLGEDGVRLARSADENVTWRFCRWALATAALELGEARRAIEIMLDAPGGELRGCRWGYTAVCELMTRAELALGRIDAAQHWAHEAEDATRGGQLGIETAVARRATAALALARGEAAQSARIALDGVARADGAAAPVEAGRCRILAAKALVQAGRRADAIAELGKAAEQLGRVGAHGYHAQAENALLRLGGRASRRARGTARQDNGLGSLTDRQREVAELVGRGHTNRDIATALFLSEKTVERHLARIFDKLGVSRRTELAVRIAGDGAPHDQPASNGGTR